MNMRTCQLLSQTKVEAWPTKLLATFMKCVRDHPTSKMSGFASSSVATLPPNYSKLNSRSLLTASFWTCKINLISNSIFSRNVEQNLNSSALWCMWWSDLKSCKNHFLTTSSFGKNNQVLAAHIHLRNRRDKNPITSDGAFIRIQ